MGVITHKRGRCAEAYKTLGPQSYNNTECVLLHVRNKGVLNPEDVTFNGKTWLENSAELLGINQVCILGNKSYIEFAYTDKIPLFLDYLKSTSYKYALVADSVDCVIHSNPDEAIKLLEYYDCEVLYSTTPWKDHDKFTMPEQSEFNNSKYNTRLNSGVCIGKVSTLIELYSRVLDYAAFEPIIHYHPTYRKVNGYKNWTQEQLAAFPKGCSDDQTIIRYLLKEFWPKIKLDTEYRLAKQR